MGGSARAGALVLALAWGARAAPPCESCPEPPPGASWTLRGAVLAGDALIRDGVLEIRDGRIVRVGRAGRAGGDGPGAALPPGVVAVPGFVDLHAHAPYAVLPRWEVPAGGHGFRSRFDWRGRSLCMEPGTFVPGFDPEDPAGYRSTYGAWYRAVERAERAAGQRLTRLVRYAALRAALGGTTVWVPDAEIGAEGLDADLAGLLRDAPGELGRPVRALLDPGCLSPAAGAALRLFLGRGALLAHAGEGDDPLSSAELPALEAHRLLGPRTGLIHGLGFGAPEWARVAAAGATVVWSPRSQLGLYGRTLDAAGLRRRGVEVALAPDWPITGSSTMLDELGAAARAAPGLTPLELVAMATRVPAAVLGLPAGVIEAGRLADLVLFEAGAGAGAGEVAAALVAGGIGRVRAVLVGGRPILADPALVPRLPPPIRPWQDLAVEVDGVRLARVVAWPGPDLAGDLAALGEAVARGSRGKVSLAPLWER